MAVLGHAAGRTDRRRRCRARNRDRDAYSRASRARSDRARITGSRIKASIRATCARDASASVARATRGISRATRQSFRCDDHGKASPQSWLAREGSDRWQVGELTQAGGTRSRRDREGGDSACAERVFEQFVPRKIFRRARDHAGCESEAASAPPIEAGNATPGEAPVTGAAVPGVAGAAASAPALQAPARMAQTQRAMQSASGAGAAVSGSGPGFIIVKPRTYSTASPDGSVVWYFGSQGVISRSENSAPASSSAQRDTQ